MMLNGTVSALKSVDRWAVIGEPNHMMLLSGDAEPWMIDIGQEGYIDFDVDYGCYQFADLSFKALYWKMIRGQQDVPSHLFTVSTPIVREPTGIYGERGEWTYDEWVDFMDQLTLDFATWKPFQGKHWSDQMALPNPDTPSWDTGIPTAPSWAREGFPVD